MIRLLLVAVLSSFLTLGSVFAADGSSGCGPAWYVLKDNSLLSSALRGTTNGILGITVTIGMTFGTSNCTKHSIVKNEQESLKFATENYFEIAADAARGEGEFIAAFATTMGCHSKDVQKFNSAVKKNFKNVFNFKKTDAKQLIIDTYKVILKDQTLVDSCIS